MSAAAIIQTEGLKQVYGMGNAAVHALDGVSMTVERGEFVAIMGPSGSGKSTLMNILGCLARPTAGTYTLDGERISDLDKRQLAAIRNRKLGFIFQAYNLLPRTTAVRNVILPLIYDRTKNWTLEEMEARAREILLTVGLEGRLEHQPHELSGGQQQRVAIARALVNDPVLIIADEPTGNLDSKSGAEIMGLLLDLHARGRTIVMVTHDDEIAAYAQRVVHLRDGRVEKVVRNDKEKVTA